MELSEMETLLMDINKQLGTIGANIAEIKEDISDLKQKDASFSQSMEDLYAKAKARQDSIRDDMQHQIDNLSDKMRDHDDRMRDTIKAFGQRIEDVESHKERAIAKWWDRIIDKVVWIFIIGGLVVILRWLNVPPEVLNQLPQ